MSLRKESIGYSTLVAPTGERSDCTVRAYAVAAQVGYDEAHTFMRVKCKRPTGDGPEIRNIRAAFEACGYEELVTRNREAYSFSGRDYYITLAQFIKAHPRGRYFVIRQGHAFAVVDGVVRDWLNGRTGPRSRIRQAWRLA